MIYVARYTCPDILMDSIMDSIIIRSIMVSGSPLY